MNSFPTDLLIDMTLLTFLIITATAVVFTRNLLHAVIMLNVFSLLMAALYLILGAPDVAITEAAIGAGVSTMIFLGALILTGEEEALPRTQLVPLLVIIATGAALIYATLGMPAFGDATAPSHQYLAPYFLQESGTEIGIPNVVTSILASYRGFDTMGEVFVVFTAGMSVLLLLSQRRIQKPSSTRK